jgi:hypothetical protein
MRIRTTNSSLPGIIGEINCGFRHVGIMFF